MSTNGAQVPPHSLEHEQIVVGTGLTYPEKLIDLREHVGAGDFYLPRHREIFRALENLDDKNLPVDVRTVIDNLKSRDQFEPFIAEPAYFAELAEAARPLPIAVHSAGLVRGYAELRALEFQTRAVNRECLEFNPQQYLDIEQFKQDAEARIFAACEQRSQTTVRTASQLGEAAMEIFERYRRPPDDAQPAAIQTGLRDLDTVVSIEPGMFVTIAARPSMGKTSLLTHIAVRAAAAGRGVFFASLETAGPKVAVRAICSALRIDWWRVTKRHLTEAEWKKLADAAMRFRELPLQVDEDPMQRMSAIRSKARGAARGGKLGLICIDYLQLVKPEQGRDTREREVAEISRAAKALAMELSVPVIMTAQLNREVERRDKHVPQLADLRESGAIEHDSDIICFITRPECYERGNPPR
jgi:replicative DNA helicase